VVVAASGVALPPQATARSAAAPKTKARSFICLTPSADPVTEMISWCELSNLIY